MGDATRLRTMVRVARLDATHVPRAASVLFEAFASDTTYSWGRALGRDPSAFRGWMESEYVPGLVGAFPKSVVALGPGEGGEDGVVGVLALEDNQPHPAAEVPADRRCIHALVETGYGMFFDALAAMKVSTEARRGRFSYFAFLATDPSAWRHGVGRALVAEGVARSRADGFEWAFALCTSPKSTALFRGAGFQRWGAVVYENFVFQGARPFASIPDEMSVMALRL